MLVLWLGTMVTESETVLVSKATEPLLAVMALNLSIMIRRLVKDWVLRIILRVFSHQARLVVLVDREAYLVVVLVAAMVLVMTVLR